jgi:MFS family permease
MEGDGHLEHFSMAKASPATAGCLSPIAGCTLATSTWERMMTVRNEARAPAWVVVILCFVALGLSFSARAALGLVMPVWSTELGWTRSFISGTGAAALIAMAAIAPFAGRLVDHHGPSAVLAVGLSSLATGCGLIAVTSSPLLFAIAFSGLSAVGFAIVATHVVSTGVAHLFETNRGLAIGIATSGATAGQFVIVPLIAWVMTAISWRWSYAALALASVLLVPLLLGAMRRGKDAESRRVAGSSPAARTFAGDLGYLVRRPVFHALFWSFLLCGYTTTGIIETHLIPFAAFCGFPPLPSATAYGVLSAVNLVGMITAGWLADRVNRPLLLGAIYLIRGATFIVLMNVGASYNTLLAFAVMFGVVDYATVPVTASLVASHLGIERMGLTMGLIAAGHAVGGALGAFVGGFIFDSTATYAIVWWSGLWLAVAAGLLVLPLSDRREAAPG